MSNKQYTTIAEYIIDNHVVGKRGKHPTIDGVAYTIYTMNEAIDVASMANIPQAIEYFKGSESARRVIITSLKDTLYEYARKNSSGKANNLLGLETGICLDNLVPVRCIYSGDKFLYDTSINKVSPFNYDVVVESLPRDEQEGYKAGTLIVTREYDPYDISPLSQINVDGQNLARINSYLPPAWRTTVDETTPAEIPQVFEEFFAKLFPDAKVREYVYQWLHNALLYRNETILVLNGVKGIGKGLFCTLVRELVGKENYAEAPVSALTSQFNGILQSKRVIVFDEIEVDKAAHTRLKRYANRDQTIERKGIEADTPTETYNSFIISNNDTSDMYLEVDDRRFSPVECTAVPLIQNTTAEWREELVATIESEEAIRVFGNWLIKHGQSTKYDTFSAWKGPNFFKLVYWSLSIWQKFLADTCLTSVDKEPICYKSLSKSFKKETNGRLPLNMSKVEDFFNNYRHFGKYVVGELEVVDGEYFIVPCVTQSEMEEDGKEFNFL